MVEVDVLIVGAGILGVAAAYHLAQRKQHVLVLERESTFGQHASSKNAGMFRQLYRDPQLTEWAMRSVKDWPKQAKSIAFEETGSLIVSRECPSHHSALFEQTYIDVSGRLTPAVRTNSDGLLSPYDLLHGIFQSTDRRYAHYQFQQEVSVIEKVGQSWQVETTKGDFFRASWVINAAGAWVNDSLQPKMPELLVKAQPFARHLFVVEGWDENFMPSPEVGYYWDETDAWYLRLWEKQARLVSICDQVPTKPESFVPDSHMAERLAERLLLSVPSQAEHLRLGPSWFCFRTYTEDRLPIWGEDDTYSGFFWLAAFGGFGMSTSFAAAEDAAKFICGEQPVVFGSFGAKRVQSQRL